MAQCSTIKANGERCKGIAATGADWCPAHDPDRAEARRAAASRAARSKPISEIKALKDQLEALYEDVVTGRVDKGEAAVCNQILNTRLRAIALERDVREQEVLEQRIAELERIAG